MSGLINSAHCRRCTGGINQAWSKSRLSISPYSLYSATADAFIGRGLSGTAASSSPIAFRPPLKAQGDDLLEQLLVGHARLFGGIGEILALRDLGIGVRFQHIDFLVCIHP